MSGSAKFAIGSVFGLALGIVVSLTTDLGFAPEIGIVVGGLLGFAAGRGSEAT